MKKDKLKYLLKILLLWAGIILGFEFFKIIKSMVIS